MKRQYCAFFYHGLVLTGTLFTIIFLAGCGSPSQRPEGPCDIFADADCPCVAAHSTTRALYASYNGPLYQVMRMSDGTTMDIGIVQPRGNVPGGYADAAAQDEFCADTYCWITRVYDQSGNGNDLLQAPRGAFSGPAMGGFNNVPVADMAPVTVMGHKVYGVFIEPGMGLRWNDAKGTAVDDQAEGQYWVINGHHYNSDCCFDYGNGETDSRDDGDGTMETTYYGNAGYWYHGIDPGPWIMTDQENNLVGCVNESPEDKYCPDLESITWRFVTAMADGEPGHWRSMGGDAQKGGLEIMFDGPRVKNERSSYDPMRKQGSIILGNGGDNSNGGQGTFYEGAMTAPGTFPSEETNRKIQANIAAAGYDVQCLTIAPANAKDESPGLQTFSPGTSQNTTVMFTNTTGSPVKNLNLSISVPEGWKSEVLNSKEASKNFADTIKPGTRVSTTFIVTSGPETFNGDMIGKASWVNPGNGKIKNEIIAEKIRNVSPIKINEFRITASSAANSTDSFIELYNAGSNFIDISGWSLTCHPIHMPVFTSIRLPPGTRLEAGEFYVLGLSNSGLSVPAKKGESTIYVRNISGMSAGDEIEIGSGSSKEIRKIVKVGNAAGLGKPKNQSFFYRPVEPGTPTTLWQPLPDGPVTTIPAGSNNIPVASVDGFEAGQKMAVGYGAHYPAVSQAIEKYEVVTITGVGKPGTQAWLSADAKAGDTNIKVSSVENISPGDIIRLDIDSKGHGIETVTVKRVGTPSVRNTFAGPLKEDEDPGTGLELTEPLKFDHSSNMPFSARGTGITFEPASKFDHSSNEPVLPLGTGIILDRSLDEDHETNAVVRDPEVKTAGYQGTPDQWFGGPALSPLAGNMLLRDDANNIVDSLNYGGLVDPWAAEGFQAASGKGKKGCYITSPGMPEGFRWWGGTGMTMHNRSAGRYPDGIDRDSNCRDFMIQNSITLSAPAFAGSDNIKVPTVEGFGIGQKIIIDTGAESEEAIIAAIGTPGATTTGAPADTDTTVIKVYSIAGFSEGQTITIDSGENRETAVIATITAAQRNFWNRDSNPLDKIKVAEPLPRFHKAGVQVSGSGIMLLEPLTKAHVKGTPAASNLPTPGEPNQYYRKAE